VAAHSCKCASCFSVKFILVFMSCSLIKVEDRSGARSDARSDAHSDSQSDANSDEHSDEHSCVRKLLMRLFFGDGPFINVVLKQFRITPTQQMLTPHLTSV